MEVNGSLMACSFEDCDRDDVHSASGAMSSDAEPRNMKTAKD